MDDQCSRRLSRKYNGSSTTSCDYTSSSSLSYTARKYSISSSSSLMRSYSTSSKASLSNSFTSSSSVPLSTRKKDDYLLDSGYWSSSSTPRSQTRASSETPSGILATQKEDISSVMSRYLPGGYGKENTNIPPSSISRAGSMSNLSSSLLSSLNTLSSASINFTTSSVLDKRASRKRRELLASTRSSSIDRYGKDDSSSYPREGSVDRTDASVFQKQRSVDRNDCAELNAVSSSIGCSFARSQSLSRASSIGRVTPEPEINRYRKKSIDLPRSGYVGSSYTHSFSSSDYTSVQTSVKKNEDVDDPSGLLSIHEGLARVTEALNRHRNVGDSNIKEKTPEKETYKKHSWICSNENSFNSNLPTLKNSFENSSSSSQLINLKNTSNLPSNENNFSLRRKSSETNTSSLLENNAKESISSQARSHYTSSTSNSYYGGTPEKLDAITMSLLLHKNTSSGRRPWRRGRLIAAHTAILSSSGNWQKATNVQPQPDIPVRSCYMPLHI